MRNGPVKRVKVEESTRHKWVKSENNNSTIMRDVSFYTERTSISFYTKRMLFYTESILFYTEIVAFYTENTTVEDRVI